jgi:hypothetical protein
LRDPDSRVRTGVFGIIEATIGHIPGVGGLVGGALTRAEQSISNALGSAITGIDARIARSFTTSPTR